MAEHDDLSMWNGNITDILDMGSDILSMSPASHILSHDDDMSHHATTSSHTSPDGSVTQPEPRLAFSVNPSINDDDRPISKRSRNACEKLRRDRLNNHMKELVQIVPWMYTFSRKLDKASILRVAVAYLRYYHVVRALIQKKQAMKSWKPEEFTDLGPLLLQTLGGFLMMINQRGQLIYATEGFTDLLKYNLVDVLDMPLFTIVHPEDSEVLQHQFKGFHPRDQEGASGESQSASSCHRSFKLRMLVKTTKTPKRYETINILGHLIEMPAHITGRSDPELCLICWGCPWQPEPITEMPSAADTTPNQWLSQHDLNGIITFSDHRGASHTGFLPGESVGFSAYHLINENDIRIVTLVHNQIFETGEIPSTVFRMYSKSRETLYMRTHTHIHSDSWTRTPRFIISINEVLEEANGKQLLEAQRRAVLGITDSESAETDTDCKETNGHKVNIEADCIGNLSVVVGHKKYGIDTQGTPSGGNSPSRVIFDPMIHKLKTRDDITMIKPRFLGDEDEGIEDSDQRRIYDVANDYIGNNSLGRPNGSDHSSPLSGLQAMLQNSDYPTRPAWPSTQHRTSNGHHKKSATCTQTLPSTDPEHNRTLVGLLNTRRSEPHIRETTTSHIVPGGDDADYEPISEPNSPLDETDTSQHLDASQSISQNLPESTNQKPAPVPVPAPSNNHSLDVGQLQRLLHKHQEQVTNNQSHAPDPSQNYMGYDSNDVLGEDPRVQLDHWLQDRNFDTTNYGMDDSYTQFNNQLNSGVHAPGLGMDSTGVGGGYGNMYHPGGDMGFGGMPDDLSQQESIKVLQEIEVGEIVEYLTLYA